MTENTPAFQELAETIGYDSFSAEIVDGKFVISPADAGISLFGYVTIAEEQLSNYQTAVDELKQEVVDVRNDNAMLRDLLERCYVVLLDAGQLELADEVIEAAYPVVGIREWEDAE